jgi:hypothetical protein
MVEVRVAISHFPSAHYFIGASRSVGYKKIMLVMADKEVVIMKDEYFIHGAIALCSSRKGIPLKGIPVENQSYHRKS